MRPSPWPAATLPTPPVHVRLYCPESVTERAAMQTGKVVTAVSKRTPSAANRSMFGVRITGLP